MLNADQMKNSLRLSVIIPTHNRPDHLLQVLAMLDKQTEKPDEIIIVQNGHAELPEQVSKDHRYTVVRTVTDAGPGQARNIGATVASGDYCAFLDDDDLWADDYLACMREAILTNSEPALLLATVVTLKNSDIVDTRTPPVTMQEWQSINLFRTNPGITGSSLIAQRRQFLAAGGFDVRLMIGEDKIFVLDCLMAGGQLVTVPQAISYYIKHDSGSLTEKRKLVVQYQLFAWVLRDRMTVQDFYYLRKRAAKAQCVVSPGALAQLRYALAGFRYALACCMGR